ncbi:AraC family transcriptional regulator [Mycobacterium sp. KBS0706]|uniref:AraC family transcriptional regulator n=1 Tax=Mycobacterium sp. KBS0706 TaxID=2578109 RepID=UPI00110F9FFC|nr:helix-turn-helix transcriptional regulator [Mycobacterium sp. KBS0706]TSD89053.1 AraC family transcriptional regulator [Mycobacterium sp. KBS0706]
MVLQATIFDYEATPRAIVALGNDHPAHYVILPHRHRRSQLLYGSNGVLMARTEQGRWVVPPERAVWIPGGIIHDVQPIGAVSMRSVYVEPDAVPGLPTECRVVGVSPLMRSLLMEAVNLPLEYDLDGRDGLVMALILQEIARMPVLPLNLPLPGHAALAARCRRFLEGPTPHDTIDDWCGALGMSRRAFTRLFRQETGLSLSAWRQQACLFAALPRLAAGEAVTTVALDLGYDSAAAFTTMFKRLLGAPPSRYFAAGAGASGPSP